MPVELAVSAAARLVVG